MPRFDAIAFDADDTLWHNERLYVAAHARFRELLRGYHEPAWIDTHLYQAEVRNLPHFGYGIKGFALSMIESAVELTEGRISGRDVQVLIDTAKQMLAAEVELLEHAAPTLARLGSVYPLLLITKGDLRDQQDKLRRSGLERHFRHVEVVTDKSVESYAGLLRRHRLAPQRFLMVGNSLRSDVLPVLELGGHAVHVPAALTWAHEQADPPPPGHPGYHRLEHLGLLPALVARLESDGGPRY